MLEAVATTPSRPFAAMCVVVRLDMIPRSSSWISVVAAREGKRRVPSQLTFIRQKWLTFQPGSTWVTFQRELPKASFHAGLRPGEGSYVERIGAASATLFFHV